MERVQRRRRVETLGHLEPDGVVFGVNTRCEYGGLQTLAADHAIQNLRDDAANPVGTATAESEGRFG